MKVTKNRIIILAFILLIIAAVVFIKALSGPAKGTITAPPAADREQQAVNYVTLDGQNFSLSYPEKYQRENTGKHAVNILESYRLTAAGSRGGLSRLVAVTIYDAPGGMVETSAYKTRTKNSSTYQKKVEKLGDYEVHFFNNIEIPETVAFIQKGGNVAAVGFSGGITDEDAQTEYDHIINSFRWR